MSLHSANDGSGNTADNDRSGQGAGSPEVPIYRSRDLFREGRRVHIEHGAGTYVLQITRQGKLILTK